MLRLPSTLVGLAIVAIALPAAAQPPPSPNAPVTVRERLAAAMEPPGQAMPADTPQLDEMMASGQNVDLTTRLRAASTADAVLLDMNWEAARLYDGAGFLLATAYMNDLWRLGSSTSTETAAGTTTSVNLRQSAVAFGLYSYELILLDGPKCADPTAPAHRRDQLFTLYRPVWTYALSLSPEDRATVVKVAVGVEQATSSVRRDDAVLCSGGMAEMQQGLAAGGSGQQVPTPPGMVGKTYLVPDAPGYRPQFLPSEKWRDGQDARRAEMAATLTRFLTPPPPAAAR